MFYTGHACDMLTMFYTGHAYGLTCFVMKESDCNLVHRLLLMQYNVRGTDYTILIQMVTLHRAELLSFYVKRTHTVGANTAVICLDLLWPYYWFFVTNLYK